MSEKLANIHEVEKRFTRFVLEHVGIAQRWEIMDARPLMPFDFVMFSREGAGTVSEDLSGFTQSSQYGMEIYMKRTAHERKADEKTIPSVYIDLQSNDVEILDPYLRLPDIVHDYRPEPSGHGHAITGLLDKLEELESREIFVPTGLRRFPDSPGY